MYPINTKNNCTIYSNSFLNDLDDHAIEDILLDTRLQSGGTEGNNSEYGARLKYKLQSETSSIVCKITDMRSLLTTYTPSTSPNYNWLPAIINHDNYIQNKEILAGTVIGNKVLGIENFIKIQNPKFKNWSILDDGNSPNTDGSSISIDWVINSNLTSIEPEYGVLYWYKKNEPTATNTTQYPIDKLPSRTIVSPVSNIVSNDTNSTVLATPQDKLIKIDNNILKFVDKSPVSWNSGTDPVFDYGTKDNQNLSKSTIDISGARNNAAIRFYAINSQNFLNNQQNLLFPDYQIWIADGEFYSYFNSAREKHDFQTHRPTKWPSRSYISPGMYHVYRAIYNALTVDRVKSLTTIGTVCYAEKLRKLCCILATSPLIDRVTINCLYNASIKDQVNTYLNAPASSSTNEEVRALLDIINVITKELSNLTDKIENQTNNNNYIRTPSQLYKKLKSKYSANLRIEPQQIKKIKFNKTLPNGAHAYFDLNHKTFCPKNTRPSTERFPSYIYNKFEYTVGDIVIKNSLDINNNKLKSQSLRVFSNADDTTIRKDVPWDITRLATNEKIRLNLGPDIVLPFTPDNGEMILSYDLDLLGDLDCFWQLVDGPECFRFSHFAKNGRIDFIKRNKISTDSRPNFYVKKPGVYTVRCQITKSSTLKASDTIRLYIGVPNPDVPPRTAADNTDTVTNKYNPLCSNLRQFAVNKYGLFWVIDSDVYTIAQSNRQIITDTTASERLLNQKLGLDFEPQVVRNADVVFKFETLTTTVKLHSVTIENMRDSLDSTSQCKSFYQDKLVRQRDTRITNINTFVARYIRQDRGGDILTFYGRGYDNDGREVRFSEEFSFPYLSTVLAPGIRSYGGYSNNVVNTIGVEIPFHPVYEGSSSRTLSLYKLPNGNWGGGSDVNPIMAKKPYIMPRMIDRNNMSDNNPNTTLKCSMMDIPVSGYTTLNKGFFHPNSGWFPGSTSQTYPSVLQNIGDSAYSSLSSHGKNITSVHRYKVYRYKSYYFSGNGIFDMRGMTLGNNTSHNTYLSRILIKDASESSSFLFDHNSNQGYRNVNGVSYRSQESIDDLYIDRCTDNETEESFVCEPQLDNLAGDCYPGIATSMYSLPEGGGINNLFIEDLEIKINFLNYPNPKNMILALEIFNPTLPALPEFNKIFISNDKQTTGVADLDTYISAINTMNTSTDERSRIIYLYNQESIENYNLNFNLLFSDNYKHQAVFDDSNKYDQYLSHLNKPIHSDTPIRSTLSSNNYSDRQSAKYKKAINNNLLPVSSASLAKFKNIPLKDTSFILKVIILGTEENALAMDNVVNNSELSGLTSFETTRKSNTIANSICSWDLIVHTNKTPKFHNKNPRGHLDYDNNSNSVIKGYNFIGDFTNKTYLIPKVNLNAPYQYLANINYYCRYINDDELSKPLTYQELRFPFVFFSWTPFFTLAGAMFAAWEISQAFSRGGRSDPLVSFLYDLRFQRMQEELERNYFQPGYEAVAQGYADKALVLLTKDDVSWYKMEVPINRYEHSDILKLKRYNYIKLSSSTAKPLSMLKFSLVTEDKQLTGPAEIKYTFSTNIGLSGLEKTVPNPSDSNSTITLKFDEGDVVELTGQTTAANNGLYVVKTGAWVRFPDTRDIRFLVNNRYGNSTNTNNLTSANITAKKIIKIKGARAFHFFDINDSVSMSANFQQENPVSSTISDKYLINITDSVYTILVLNAGLSSLSEGYVYKNTNNTLLVYSSNETINDDSTIGKWGLAKSTEELGNRLVSKIGHSAMGEGNYGYGTPYVDPDTYSSLSYDSNHIKQVYDTMDNTANDAYKYNKIFLESNGTNTTIDFDPDTDSPAQLCKYYPFSINDYDYAKDTAGYQQILASETNAEDKANLNIDLVGSILQPDKQSYYFMDLKSEKFSNVAEAGYLYIENDYIKYKPTQKLSTAQRNSIQQRIDFISTTGIPPADLPTTSISNIDNIPDLLTVYSTTAEELNVCQYPNFSNTGSACKKQQSKLKLLQLCDERAKLLKILENDDMSSPNVLPIYEIIYNTIPQNGQAGVPPKISIEYRTKDYFWFNIDANQSCSWASEAMPRILYQTEYRCSPIVEFYQYPECNSVCLFEEVKGGADFDMLTENGIQILQNKKVEEEKAKYPQVTNWGLDTETFHDRVEKKFFLSCGENFRDTLLTVRERYLYPKIDATQRFGAVKDVFNLDNTDSIKMKFRIIPRKLKTIDPIFQRYVYDYNGNLAKDIIPPPGGPMFNGLSIWRCIDFNRNSPNLGKMVDPPLFFKVQNEMIFRAYFGSTDGIEIKNSPISEAKEFWEWIPYEYFDGPIIE